MTMHGTIMVFFVLTTAPFAAFGNYFLPIQVGAEDMAFPRFNMMSFWITFVAFWILIAAFLRGRWPAACRLDAYAPLSAVGSDAGPGRRAWASRSGGFRSPSSASASLLGSLNFIATTLDLRAKGMSLMRACRSCTWAWFITSCIGLTGVCGVAARLHSADSRSRGRHQLLHSRRVWSSTISCSRTPADHRCSGSTCSGSSDIPRCTSPSCRRWGSSLTS